jgi:hypothetical protein
VIADAPAYETESLIFLESDISTADADCTDAATSRRAVAVKVRAAIAAIDTDASARRVSAPAIVEDDETGNETE